MDWRMSSFQAHDRLTTELSNAELNNVELNNVELSNEERQ